ncbi:MAG: flavodoxin reductase [Ignavibacteriae bacterium]|nr:flavodoxin reductase [Ignavibacteriota bacterium]NOG97894.1 flavodoxin reductase [Ignavibacteriota bacterium]
MSKLDYEVEIIEKIWLAPDVIQLILERPANYHFNAGQAAEITIDRKAFEGLTAPFTFTGLMDTNYLELMIKIYKENKGLTLAVSELNKGDKLQISEPWDSYQLKGPGVFIAGGSGITPFISILRNLKCIRKDISEYSLIWANKTWNDVFLKNELTDLLNSRYHNILSRENKIPHDHGRINKYYLKSRISNFNQPFYICGPKHFGEQLRKMLFELGADKTLINTGY